MPTVSDKKCPNFFDTLNFYCLIYLVTCAFYVIYCILLFPLCLCGNNYRFMHVLVHDRYHQFSYVRMLKIQNYLCILTSVDVILCIFDPYYVLEWSGILEMKI